jgi:hypothetical protein
MVVDRDFLGLVPDLPRHLSGQGGIELLLQLRQLFHAQLVVEIAPYRMRIWRPDQVSTDRL